MKKQFHNEEVIKREQARMQNRACRPHLYGKKITVPTRNGSMHAFIYNKENLHPGYLIVEDRYEGYQQGLRDCGIPFREEYVYQAKQSTEPDYIALGAEAAKYYEGLDETPKAVIAAIDALAIGCVQQFQKDGVCIPEQVNVIGFDNISLSSLIQPPLTTISQPIRLIGQKAAEIIIAKLDGREIEDKVVFPGNLILRATTDL